MFLCCTLLQKHNKNRAVQKNACKYARYLLKLYSKCVRARTRLQNTLPRERAVW